ncbi:MAG: hypothetical protein MOB07_13665 [Acidobacteria bacterium]|nr:hypothetical protein [Acidobacteriota bacterium]
MLLRTKLFKLLLIGLFGVVAAVYCLDGRQVGAFSTGPPASRTGAPALGTFPAETTCNACHTSFPLNSGPGTLTITGLPATYSPNQEISVTVTVNQADRVRYGFEATVLDDQGQKVGELVVTDANRMRIVDGAGSFVGRQYIEHILAGTAPTGTNQGSWTFTWRAPAQSVGRVTFYVAGNAASGTSGNQQDYIFNTRQSVQAAGSLPTVSAASFVPTGSLTVESIAAIFGMGLADGMAGATTLPLPITLAGATVRVRDAAGMERDAPLFFAMPGQINFLIPQGTGNGVATITVLRNNTAVGTSTVTIEGVAPSLFAANMNGQGVAAAVVFRIKADGSRGYEPVGQFNQATNRFEPVPIDLGPASDQVFLVCFGTGMRNRSGNSNLCNIGGTAATVTFIGAQDQFVGLDQANILLPRSLAGRGDLDVALVVDGRKTNMLSINAK